MKSLFLLVILNILFANLMAQDSRVKVIENKAREMHRVVTVSDKEQWKTFIKENYTQALIDKPMKAKIETSDNDDSGSTSKTEAASTLEEKAMMFQRLHNDFGNSKILSIKPDGDHLEMILESTGGLTGTFRLKFEKKMPYLIDGIGIEVNETQ